MNGSVTITPKTGSLPDGQYTVYGLINDESLVLIYKSMVATQDITQIELDVDSEFPKFDSVIVYFWSENMYIRPIASTECDGVIDVDFQPPSEWVTQEQEV